MVKEVASYRFNMFRFSYGAGGKVKLTALHNLICRGLIPKQFRLSRRTFGIRHILCSFRKRRGFLLGVFVVFILFLYSVSTFIPSSVLGVPGWVLPETCIADDCQLKDPLPLSKLSPNLLLVLIHANAKSRDRRDAIRATWLARFNNQPNSPIQYRFIVGGQNVPPTTMNNVFKEANDHKDMLIFPMITDSRYSLANRTLLSFKYAYNFFNFKYALKCDDDTFVDLLRIATELEQRKSTTPFYWGYMNSGNQVLNHGPYSENKWSVCDKYATYALGGGYILSKDTAGIIANISEQLRLYNCEDVSMGAWLAPYNIELKHDARFNVNSPSRGCKDPYMIIHKVSALQMTLYQESMLLEGRICSWRTYSYGSDGYIFNWTLPKDCCRRDASVP